MTDLTPEEIARRAGDALWAKDKAAQSLGMALIAIGRTEFPDADLHDILDCADAAGRAMEALRAGQRIIRLDRASPAWNRVGGAAASIGAIVLAECPPALDLGQPGAARKLRSWLEGDNTAKLR